ncbi:MAG: DsbA family protein [Rubrivivax sp.]|nr:DsbA family protein [Rubrivivax sp.]
MHDVLAELGRDGDDCIALSSAPPTKLAYLAATDRARSLGIFGSPTFVVDQEIFWGDDWLEDALAWCQTAAV